MPFPQSLLVFDIETVPDLETGKRLYPNLAKLSDADTLSALTAIRQSEAGNDFMRPPLHKVACLSLFWFGFTQQPNQAQMRLKSFSLADMDEAQILSKFFAIFADKHPNRLPNLVSWNGSSFDIPVLMYRAMHHKLSAPEFFDENSNRDIQYNNYLNRYHNRHTDLMDKLSLFAGHNKQPLDVMASVCGFAGKGGMNGSQVVGLVQTGNWQQLTTYCESDVLNTWLIYLRWQLLVGGLDATTHQQLEQITVNYLDTLTDAQGQRIHQAFLDGWNR